MVRDPKIEFLRAVPTLATYQDGRLAELAARMEQVVLPPGAVLTREGTPAAEAFLIIEGEVAVTLRGRQIATLGAGDFAGEMALIDHSPRSATVTAMTDLRVFKIDPASFAALLKQPGVAGRMLISMTQRLRDAEAAPSYDRPASPS